MSALLGADTLPDVSTARMTTSVGPSVRQEVIVDPPPITPSVEAVHAIEMVVGCTDVNASVGGGLGGDVSGGVV